jgi:hypothetical protein
VIDGRIEQATVADTATKDLTQDVATAFVRGNYTVIDKERSRTGVVGYDAEAGVGD